ncbi:UPF0481 protein At3g47200-like [Ziziphus jujuba]|uniref:UPF0481 protein At3g47200-like n=1 Tax=Ziziphus jujuba TaxID=326968 RepID=A0ABM4A954_ZIZJJ|nr:UPF0481 protein At3g47200-like [Ziziphus jujuba]
MDRNSHQVDVVKLIRDELKEVPQIPECCIYRVPFRLKSGPFREGKEEVYIPKVVSIGPLHHGNKGLEKMEEKKMIYIKDFLERNDVSLEHCVDTVEESLGKIRKCYEESLGYNENEHELVKIILVDAVFVIETLVKCRYENFRDDNNRMFRPFVLPDVRTEFLLLENQLPFFILKELFKFTKDINISLIDFCFSFLSNCYIFYPWPEEEYMEQIKDTYEPKHLVDLLWKISAPLVPHEGESCESVLIPSATRLHQAGAKLKKGSAKNLLDIHFENGTLTIPKLLIDDGTEIILRNLIGFEQCHNSKINYVTVYITFMDSIIDTPKDVDLLVQEGIIENWLGDSSEVSSLINRLGEGIHVSIDLYHAQLAKNINSYCKNPWHSWKANLKQNYFNTPWVIISFLAALVLIVLTIIQTVCSIIST